MLKKRRSLCVVYGRQTDLLLCYVIFFSFSAISLIHMLPLQSTPDNNWVGVSQIVSNKM